MNTSVRLTEEVILAKDSLEANPKGGSCEQPTGCEEFKPSPSSRPRSAGTKFKGIAE